MGGTFVIMSPQSKYRGTCPPCPIGIDAPTFPDFGRTILTTAFIAPVIIRIFVHYIAIINSHSDVVLLTDRHSVVGDFLNVSKGKSNNIVWENVPHSVICVR